MEVEQDQAAPAHQAGAETVRQEEAQDVDLHAALAEAERRAEEYLAQLQRLKADFDNYRRRMMQEQVRWEDNAVGRFLAGLLPVLDNLERGLSSAATADAASLREGMALILRQLEDLLARSGVQPIEALGRPFDPTRHEAMARVEEGDYEEDTVVEVFQKGYLYKGAVRRPALVKVAVARPAPMIGSPTARLASSRPGSAAQLITMADRPSRAISLASSTTFGRAAASVRSS